MRLKMVRPAIFLTLILLTGLYFSYATIAGSIQDKRYAADSQLLQSGKEFLQQARYPEAAKNIGTLVQRYPDSFEVLYMYGLIQYCQGNVDLAQKYLEKAKTQRVFLINDPAYLGYYGSVLALNGDYTRAQKYLLRAKSLKPEPSMADQIDTMLKDLSNKIPNNS